MPEIGVASLHRSRVKVAPFPAHRSETFSAASLPGSEALLSQPLLSIHEALAHRRDHDLWSLLIPLDLKIVFDLDWEKPFVKARPDRLTIRVLFLQQFEWRRNEFLHSLEEFLLILLLLFVEDFFSYFEVLRLLIKDHEIIFIYFFLFILILELESVLLCKVAHLFVRCRFFCLLLRISFVELVILVRIVGANLVARAGSGRMTSR